MKFNSQFKAVFFGVSKFTKDNELTPIPNIEVNLEELADVFTDKSIMGVPEENITIIENPTELELKKESFNLKANTDYDDTLLVYYSGHGIFSKEDFNIYLAGTDSESDYVHINGLSIQNFKKFINSAKARRKFIILDCCYSGVVHEGAMGGNIQDKLMSQINQYTGTYTLSSSSESGISLFPVHSPYDPTFFTGKLVEFLRKGINNDKPYTTMQELFIAVKQDFEQQESLPIPQASAFNNLYEIPIAFNNAYIHDNHADKIDIIDRNITPFNHIYMFHGPQRGASTFIGGLLRTIQNSLSTRLRLFSKTNEVLDYFNTKIANNIDKNEYPAPGENFKGVELDVGLTHNKSNKTIRFSLLDVCGEDSLRILEHKNNPTDLLYYLVQAKLIVLFTSVEHAAEDDLNISKFFEVLHDLKITIPIELIISHWDKHDRTRSLNKFVEQEMPNTYSWLSTEEFKDAGTYNFSIYSKKDSTKFDTSNNTYIKQFVNRLWENIYRKRQNVFDTGAVDIEKQEELKKKHRELNTLFTEERIKEVFGILLKSKLPEDDIDKLMTLENNWLNIENLENMELVLSDKSLKKKSFIQNELFKYINEV